MSENFSSVFTLFRAPRVHCACVWAYVSRLKFVFISVIICIFNGHYFLFWMSPLHFSARFSQWRHSSLIKYGNNLHACLFQRYVYICGQHIHLFNLGRSLSFLLFHLVTALPQNLSRSNQQISHRKYCCIKSFSHQNFAQRKENLKEHKDTQTYFKWRTSILDQE